jgi:hypothetical protein
LDAVRLSDIHVPLRVGNMLAVGTKAGPGRDELH